MKSQRSPRFIASILLVRLVRSFMKALGRKGTHFPGQLAKKLCPDFLSRIEKPDQIIAVTGTNGKTTVANLVADMARRLGLSFAHNAYGSNIEEGIITALLDASSLTGRKKKPLAILEIDERLTRIVFKTLKPDYLIVTNLFRESYLRNAHGEFIFRILDENIDPDTQLIVNADDLLSQELAQGRPHHSFGIARLPHEAPFTHNLIRDRILCPRCQQPLTDDFIRYHHIGRAHCPACGWTSMEADYEITRQGPDSFDLVRGQDHQALETYPFQGENILDLYNVLAAVALFRTLGYPASEVAAALDGLAIGKSRKEVTRLGNKTIYRMLAKGKNPIAVSRVIEAISSLEGEKQFILLFDTSQEKMSEEDNSAWLYDADLAVLADPRIVRLVVGGQRARDVRLALLLAGVPGDKIVISRDKEKTGQLLLDSPQPMTIAILYELYSEAISRQVVKDLVKDWQEAKR